MEEADRQGGGGARADSEQHVCRKVPASEYSKERSAQAERQRKAGSGDQ